MMSAAIQTGRGLQCTYIVPIIYLIQNAAYIS